MSSVSSSLIAGVKGNIKVVLHETFLSLFLIKVAEISLKVCIKVKSLFNLAVTSVHASFNLQSFTKDLSSGFGISSLFSKSNVKLFA